MNQKEALSLEEDRDYWKNLCKELSDKNSELEIENKHLNEAFSALEEQQREFYKKNKKQQEDIKTLKDCIDNAANETLTQIDKIEELENAKKLQPIESWGEDYGDCLWWKLPIVEPPYCGTPLDCDFPEYVTHFTRLIEPTEPKD